MCAEQAARVPRRSWAGYTINMFEFEFPTGTGAKAHDDCIKAFSETVFTEDLKKIDVPTLVVHGLLR
jgi:hypothetical protein